MPTQFPAGTPIKVNTQGGVVPGALGVAASVGDTGVPVSLIADERETLVVDIVGGAPGLGQAAIGDAAAAADAQGFVDQGDNQPYSLALPAERDAAWSLAAAALPLRWECRQPARDIVYHFRASRTLERVTVHVRDIADAVNGRMSVRLWSQAQTTPGNEQWSLLGNNVLSAGTGVFQALDILLAPGGVPLLTGPSLYRLRVQTGAQIAPIGLEYQLSSYFHRLF